MNKILRKCISCSKIQAKEFMHKITYVKSEKKLYLNPDSKHVGYSMYVCKNPSCINECIKKKKIRKIFSDCKIPNFDEIESVLKV